MKVIKLVLAIFLCSAAIGYAQSNTDIGGPGSAPSIRVRSNRASLLTSAERLAAISTEEREVARLRYQHSAGSPTYRTFYLGVPAER